MSATAMGMALGVKGISPRAKLVLIAVANSADEATFFGYPSRRHLAEAADCSVDTVDRCLRELVDEGLLTKEERDRDDGRGQTSNLFRVFPAHDPSRKSAATPSRENAEGGQRKLAQGGAEEMRPPQPQAFAAPPAAKDAAPKEPLSEPLVVSYLAAPVSKQQIEALIERAGDAINATQGGVHHGGDLNRYLRAGCTGEDVLSAVDKLSASFRGRGKRFGTWALLEEHVLEIRDRRLAGLPDARPIAFAPRGARPSMSDAIDRAAAKAGLK